MAGRPYTTLEAKKIMREYADRDTAELAREVGRSPDAIKSWVCRRRKKEAAAPRKSTWFYLAVKGARR
jgi:hypothetical protein